MITYMNLYRKLTAIDQTIVKQHEQRTNAEIEKLKKEVEKLESNNKGMQFTIGAKNSTISQQEDQISELNQRLAELEEMITGLNNEVKVLGDTNKSSQEQLIAAKKRCDVLESTVKVSNRCKVLITIEILNSCMSHLGYYSRT